MNPSIFPLLASVLTFGPCITMNLDCDDTPNGVLLVEIHRTPPPWSPTAQPVEWTAFAICPPSKVTWCVQTSPPFYFGWWTFTGGGQNTDSGTRYYP